MAHAFLIGYREDDPKRFQMREHTILSGRCGSCRRNVYLNPSGVEAMRDRDCIVYCSFCAHVQGEYDFMVQDLH